MLKEGDSAPDFSLPDQHGEMIRLEDLLSLGQLVLYFYPADFTPVCTAQACAFRDDYEGVEELGVRVVGVSPQSADSHERFVKRYDIPFTLLSDVDKTVIRAYGVDGPFGLGVRRATFLISREGTIEHRLVADFSATSHLEVLRKALP